ncbi:hypothetical protein IKP13_09960 [bacterium]|nr:hypothetical protein [bacterium]
MKKMLHILFFLVFSATCIISCSKEKSEQQPMIRPSGKFVPKSELNRAQEKSSENQSGKTIDEKMKEANESVSDSFREHGRNSVLHHSDKLDKNEMTHGKYVINEPDYDMPPRPIEFKSLKKVYTYFRLKEKLPEPVVESLNGSLVTMVGAVMPFDKIPENGRFSTFWLSNPAIVLKGCVFCNPPTMGDIVYAYKDAGEIPFEFEREKLFKQVLLVQVTGRFFFGPDTINGQTFLNSILVQDIEILN